MPVNRFAISIGALISLWASSALAAAPTKDECIAANETAQDLRQAGKLLEARTKLVLCVATSCPAMLREDCAQRLSEIDKATPSIVFEMKDSAGNDLSAVTVTVDGRDVAETLDGRPVAVDPAKHRFVFRAESGATAEKTFVVLEGEKDRRERIVLGVAPAVPKIGEAPVGERSSFALDRIPTAAYVAAGVGVVGLAVGIGTGIAATSKHSALEGEGCPASGGMCPPAAQDDLNDFHTLKSWSTVWYVIGAAGIVGGVGIWLIVPKATETKTGVWIGPGSAGWAGTF